MIAMREHQSVSVLSNRNIYLCARRLVLGLALSMVVQFGIVIRTRPVL